MVAPCYNEEAGLAEFCRRVVAACEAQAPAFEVVLINDGSRDGTWPIMCDLARRDPHLVCVNLSRNHGHQLALTAGLTVCRGRRVLIIDSDLQDPPELVGEMMRLMDGGADVVYGQRRRRRGESLFKRGTAAIFYRLIGRLTSTPIPADTGDFRLISRRALAVLLSMPEKNRFIRGMVSWIGFTQVPLAYDRDPRFAGETKYPVRKMVKLAMDAVTSFSVKPLILAIYLGLTTSVLALLLVIYSVVSWVFFDAVAGWTSQMAAISLLGGVQLLVLGIIGEYLGRLYDEIKGRPLFIIQDIVRGQRGGQP